MKKATISFFVPILIVAGSAPTSARAQIATPDECAALPSTDAELECLRRALTASQEALRGSRNGAPLETPSQTNDAREPAAAAADSRSAEIARNPELGAEQVASRAGVSPERPAEQIQSVIAAFRTDRRGLLIMKLANGQIWRQLEDVDLPVRLDEEERATVEIARSGFGGYRMSFPEKGKRIAVARIQ